MAELLIDVSDQIRTLLEPGPPGVVHNTDAAQPFLFEHNTIYCWPQGDDEHRQHGDGKQDEERFTIVAAYAVSDQGERRDKDRLRSISLALDAKAHDWVAIIRANRVYPHTAAPLNRLWSDLIAVINHNAIRTVGKDAVRGFTVTIRGWRLVGP
jgi:hypothetical protein